MVSQAIITDLPNGTELLENQVAGHTFHVGSDEIGMLRDKKDGSVMKAAVKPMCGVREIQFYEQLQENEAQPNPDLRILREINLVPKYHGTVKMPFRGKMIDFIKLEDMTRGMIEPCVIDIKIGKRTWDPFASPEKVKAEEQKYAACKQKLGFCIPGFQVYDIKTGRMRKFGKDYGKKLDQDTVKDALKIFLNAESGMNRKLLLEFLQSLMTVEAWAKSQTSLRLYSSSLLLAYDASILRNELSSTRKGQSNPPLSMNGSLLVSPQRNVIIQHNGDISLIEGSRNAPLEIPRNVQQSTHKDVSEYDEIANINLTKPNHELERDKRALVKMIDFAHVFPASDNIIDINYLFGIQNLVTIFQEFIIQTLV